MGAELGLESWILSVWRDLAWTGVIGIWFGGIAHIARLRRGDQLRTSMRCLIADCLIGMTASELALIACVANGMPVTATLLTVAVAGYLGQVALDWIARRWARLGDGASNRSAD